MSEEVKQEGEFKAKKPSKPKNLGKTNEVTKIEIPSTAVEAQGEVVPEVTKVEIKEEDAVQTQETDGSDVTIEGSEDSSDSQKVVEEVRETEEKIETPLTLVEETEVNDPVEVTKEPVQQTEPTPQLPENIEKLVSFMEETGGTVEDYVRLNADYTNVDNNTLVREYYKQTRPHLDHDDVSLLLEDFSYDEELDDEKEIRKKKIAFKEEVGKAKNFLENLKGKYYDEIKLRPGVTQEQQKAVDFFNRYTEEQNAVKQLHDDFVNRTNNFLTDDFKGFDFTVGDKKFRYGVKNPKQIADAQSDITNFIGTFLDKENKISDLSSYHKALYAARNADTLAQHFYEQGKADAVKDVMAKSKNISTEPRQTAQGEVFVNGLKVKAISGVDSSKLKVKKVTLKN
tara:strand:- start:1154 stop:2347 length:1194 start_codon:yes stop_codon:yes gene_type:complete